SPRLYGRIDTDSVASIDGESSALGLRRCPSARDLLCWSGMTATALTTLSEEERLLSESVLAFARERVAPHVARMDEESRLEPALLPSLFELGLMGIEIPERYGGAGGSFMNAILAVEALARVDASLAV